MIVRLLILLLGCLWQTAALADSIPLRSGDVRLEEEAYVVDVEFELTFNHTLEDALQRGVALYFSLDIEISRNRWLFDDTVGTQSQTWRLSYSPLTRDYRLSSGLYAVQVRNIQAAARQISRIRGRKVIDKALLKKGEKYTVSVILQHDITQLPKPLQVSAISNREWTMASETAKFTLIP
jgi:Domain of unknown function (DUF4390)